MFSNLLFKINSCRIVVGVCSLPASLFVSFSFCTCNDFDSLLHTLIVKHRIVGGCVLLQSVCETIDFEYFAC